ncbi:hypothetical protein [Abyssisolibacter fermentans]|uniref:hypothetical protein n=1 Tax=Abyssisolibacter fermentans TaxID=1766203 RepID=UPI00082B7003|nr:hypothetical protein [Abyssisolibacter fermentans]
MLIKANDEAILNIQEIFRHIHHLQYEEAFFLSSVIIERKDNGDQLFHEWIKALTEFYSCNKKNTAIQLLEKIKPNKLENEIHFKIINSLMCFYIETGYEKEFFKYKEVLSSNLHNLKSEEFLIKIMCNFCNGLYEFKYYKKSLEYCGKSIEISQKHRLFDFDFSKIIMIKILNLLYLGEITKAKNQKNDFETFLKITNNISDMELLEKCIKKYNKQMLHKKNI